MNVVLSQNSFTMLYIFLELENHHNIPIYPLNMLIVPDIYSVYLSHVFCLFFSGPLGVFFIVLYVFFLSFFHAAS